MDVGVRMVKVFRQCEWKASQTFVVSCGLPLRDAQRLDGNGASQSIFFRQSSQLLILLSTWHRSDAVCDRAVAYFRWIVKNKTIWYTVNNMLIEHDWLHVGGYGWKKGYVIQVNQVRFGDRIREHDGWKEGAACFSLGTIRIWFLSVRVTSTAENSQSAKQQLYNDVVENVRNCCPKLCNVGKRFMLNDKTPVNLVHVKLWYLRICGQWRRKVHNIKFYKSIAGNKKYS
jgi:hypothetical protein